MLDELAENRDIDAPAAVLTGYFADHRQVAAVADFLAQQKSQRPDLKIVCDPVIGDATGLYVAPKTAAAIRDDLVAIADIATPNRHELAWLTRAAPARDLAEAEDQARRLGPATVLVTSAPIAEEARRAESTANLLVTAQASWVVEHRLVRGPKNGPGDLTAGLFCGHLALRRSPRDAFVRTTASVLGLMRRSEPRGDAEMALAGNQAEIVDAARQAFGCAIATGTRMKHGPCIGVDGCKAGWIAVVDDGCGFADDGRWNIPRNPRA